MSINVHQSLPIIHDMSLPPLPTATWLPGFVSGLHVPLLCPKCCPTDTGWQHSRASSYSCQGANGKAVRWQPRLSQWIMILAVF